jgi:mannose-6-phosphate isomerase
MVVEPDGTVTLTEFIARDPVSALGATVAGRFGARLPYLLKVLAAAEPLSLQAHPDAERALAGYAAERAGAGTGNYVDPFHKPELLVAIDDFEGLCGFRDPGQTAAVLRGLGVAELAPVIGSLSTGPAEARLRRAVELLLGWPAEERKGLIAAVTDRGRPPSSAHPDVVRAGALAAELGRRYPADVGVVLALLLNHVLLRRDEAVFMPPGVLHAYLSGVGVEVMAASDNVLRGGLTRKRVDAIELCRVLRYEVLPDPVIRPVSVADGVVAWPTTAAEFTLIKAVAPPAGQVTVPGDGPRIVICVAGDARLRAGEQTARLAGGEAVFVSAVEPAVELSGDGAVAFQASTFQASVFQASVFQGAPA